MTSARNREANAAVSVYGYVSGNTHHNAANSAALGTVLSPKTFANRAQIAVMMTRYLDYKGGENG